MGIVAGSHYAVSMAPLTDEPTKISEPLFPWPVPVVMGVLLALCVARLVLMVLADGGG